MAVEDCVMATKPMLADKVTDINRLLNHKFTNEELNEKLRRQGTLDTKMLVFKRMETERKLQMARAYGDKDEIEALEAQMQEYSGPKLAFGTTLSKPRTEKKTEQERLADLNLRNQKLNYEHVRRAEIEERRAARKAAAAIARGSTTDLSRDGTPLTGPDSPAKSGSPRGSTPLSSQKSANKGPTGMIRYRNNDDENIAALDIELDVEV